MEGNRQVAGLWCSEVLEQLSDYLDGTIDPTSRARIEEHVRGCDVCARFGQRFSVTVTALKASLGAPRPMPPTAAERLRRTLEEKLGR